MIWTAGGREGRRVIDSVQQGGRKRRRKGRGMKGGKEEVRGNEMNVVCLGKEPGRVQAVTVRHAGRKAHTDRQKGREIDRYCREARRQGKKNQSVSVQRGR